MRIQEIIAAVATFHDAFGIENNNVPTTDLTAKDIELHPNTIQVKSFSRQYLRS